MIFGDEWEWKRIPTPKGRVFSLRNKAFPEEMYIYWMQYANTTEDEYNEMIISNILRTGQLEINENPKASDNVEMTSVEESIPKLEETKKVEKSKESNNQTLNNTTTTKPIDNKKFLSNLSNEFQRKKRKKFIILAKFPGIQKLLSNFNIENFFSDEDKEKLIKYYFVSNKDYYLKDNKICLILKVMLFLLNSKLHATL